MSQLRLDLEASGKAIRKKAQQHIIHLLTVRWKALCVQRCAFSFNNSQQRTASASNRSEDFLHVSEVAVSRVAVCDAQHDLR